MPHIPVFSNNLFPYLSVVALQLLCCWDKVSVASSSHCWSIKLTGAGYNLLRGGDGAGRCKMNFPLTGSETLYRKLRLCLLCSILGKLNRCANPINLINNWLFTKWFKMCKYIFFNSKKGFRYKQYNLSSGHFCPSSHIRALDAFWTPSVHICTSNFKKS